MGQKQWSFEFEEGDGKNKMLLGGKGANLCEMTQIGLNVPPGFVITTDACLAYLEKDRPARGLMDEVSSPDEGARERRPARPSAAPRNPLLVSVRSGSAMSMPGMMDTILNLGLNEATLKGLIAQTGNPRFGYDAWRRFIQLFGKIALGIGGRAFRRGDGAIKTRYGARQDVDLQGRTSGRTGRRVPAVVKRIPASPSPKIPTSNWKSPSARYSVPGTASAPSTIASSSRSPRKWPTARRSISAPWCSATWATTPAPASASRAIPAPAKT